LITQEEALLWTDGRYYIQAENELSIDWKLMKMEKNEVSINKYIEEILYKKIKKEYLYKTLKIGIDTNLITQGKF